MGFGGNTHEPLTGIKVASRVRRAAASFVSLIKGYSHKAGILRPRYFPQLESEQREMERVDFFPAAMAIIFATMVVISGAAAQEPTELGAARHREPRSGTTLDYPKGLFSSRVGPSRLGTGERLVTEDRRATLSIYSLPAARGSTPGSLVRNNVQSLTTWLSRGSDVRRVHYKRITARFFALSAVRGGRIFYTRCNLGRTRTLHCFEVSYPANEKRAWDRPVTRMSHSLGSS